MRPPFIFISALLLTSCDNNANNTYDVQYYLDNPNILSETIKKCNNDPGTLGKTPNCINAAMANRRLFLNFKLN